MASTAGERTRLSDRLVNAGVSNAALAAHFDQVSAANAQTVADNAIENAVANMLAGRLYTINLLPAPLRQETWQRFLDRRAQGLGVAGLGTSS